MASVLLRLPDEMLAEIDAIRPDGIAAEVDPQGALVLQLTMDRNQVTCQGGSRLKPLPEAAQRSHEADERNDTAALAKLERAAPSPGRTPVGRSRTVIRQGTHYPEAMSAPTLSVTTASAESAGIPGDTRQVRGPRPPLRVGAGGRALGRRPFGERPKASKGE